MKNNWKIRKSSEEFEEIDGKNLMGPAHDRVEALNNRIYYTGDIADDKIVEFNKMMRDQINRAKVHAAINETSTQGYGKIFVHIHSFGGCVFSGHSGQDTILEAKQYMPVVTIVEGCVASAATFLSVVGTHRQMRKHAYMLVHQLSSGFWGKYDEMKDEMHNLDLMMNTIRNVYKEYTKIPPKELDKILIRDIWWDAETCKKYGLIDEII